MASNQIVGADTSNNQATVDMGTVAKAGTEFHFLKASEGDTFTDQTYVHRRNEAHAAGLLVGPYHFGLLHDDPLSNARHFAAIVGRLDGRGMSMLPGVLDMEDRKSIEALHLTPAQVTAWTLRFLNAAEALTFRTPMLYADLDFLEHHMAPDPALGRHLLWLADYATTAPTAPHTWAAWTFWQYTNKATVPGILKPADMSLFHGTLAELDDLALMTPTPPVVVHPAPPGAHYPPWPGRILHDNPHADHGVGTQGSDVATWQGRMVTRGVHLTVDGRYGPASAAACEAFQRAAHLGVDGAVGPVTWAACYLLPVG